MVQSLPLVYIVGDSISIQYGPYLEKFLAGHWRYGRKSGEAEALLNLDRPAGANGGDSSMVLDYLRARMAQSDFQPDLLLLNCGLHDIRTHRATGAKQVELPRYEENLSEITRLAAGRQIPLAWVRTTHVNDELHNTRQSDFDRFSADLAAYDEAACRVMGARGIPVIDLCGFSQRLGPDAEVFCDHVHFAEPAREKQGAFLAGWLVAWREAQVNRAG